MCEEALQRLWPGREHVQVTQGIRGGLPLFFFAALGSI